MAGSDMFGEVASGLTERLFSGILWFGVAMLIVCVVGFLMWFFLIYKKKFDIEVKIKSERAEDKYSIIYDKAAILYKFKTKLPYFRVWGLRTDFPVPKYKILQSTSRGDLLEILRKGEKEFYFLTPSRIDKQYIIKSDGKRYPMASQSQILIDPEMAFWSYDRNEKNEKMFDTEKIWMKILPYIPHIVSGVIVIFILYILMDHLPGILDQLSELTKTLNQQKLSTAAQVTTHNP